LPTWSPALAGIGAGSWHSGVVTLFAGIAVLAWPGRALVVIAVALSVWQLFFRLMEITAAFRLRSVGHRARARTVHAT
jgi:uncharacterized membrane protein HdeD (DUF308 family)